MSSTEPTIHEIAGKRWKIAIALSVIMLVIYFGFILLVAFGKSFLSMLLAPGLSVGILMGALVIVSSWVLALIYARWCNQGYDEDVARAARSGRK